MKYKYALKVQLVQYDKDGIMLDVVTETEIADFTNRAKGVDALWALAKAGGAS